MRFRKHGRLAAGVVAASLIALQALAPVATAKAPNWDMTVTQLVSGGVSSGGVQGFAIHIVNNGPSNISSLYLVSSVTDSVAYVSDTRCTTSGRLVCNFGAVVDNQTIDLTVAYQVPFSSGGSTVTFELNTTGNVPGKNNSHGDAFDVAQTVTLVAGDTGASWTLDGTVVSNDQNLTKRNPQATSAGNLANHLAVVVQDGTGVSFDCSSCVGSAFGQASSVTVGDGSTQPAPFKIIILERGQSVPGSVDINTLSVYHITASGVDHITARCDSATSPSVVPATGCLVASWAGSNLQIVLWVWYNGSFKGYS